MSQVLQHTTFEPSQYSKSFWLPKRKRAHIQVYFVQLLTYTFHIITLTMLPCLTIKAWMPNSLKNKVPLCALNSML